MIDTYDLSYEQIIILLRLATWCIERKIPPFDKGFEGNEFRDSREDCTGEVAEFVKRLWGAKCCCEDGILLKCTCFDAEKLADSGYENHGIDPSKQ